MMHHQQASAGCSLVPVLVPGLNRVIVECNASISLLLLQMQSWVQWGQKPHSKRTSFYHLRYLGDLYELELQAGSGVRGWSIPETKRGGPSARESHSAVAHVGLSSPKLYIFGGMQGCRLDDLWQLDLGRTIFLGRLYLRWSFWNATAIFLLKY